MIGKSITYGDLKNLYNDYKDLVGTDTNKKTSIRYTASCLNIEANRYRLGKIARLAQRILARMFIGNGPFFLGRPQLFIHKDGSASIQTQRDHNHDQTKGIYIPADKSLPIRINGKEVSDTKKIDNSTVKVFYQILKRYNRFAQEDAKVRAQYSSSKSTDDKSSQ